MISRAIQLPWSMQTMPHAALDIIRGCNISCRACYNTQPPTAKPLQQIREELDQLLAHRRLHTLTITGGEATLHPQLCDVVRLVRDRGLIPSLITNGLLLDAPLVRALKAAGLEVLIVHIDPGQTRSDLPPNPTLEQINALRRAKGELIASHGLAAGLAATLYRSRPEEAIDLVRLVLHSPHIHILLAANCTRIARLHTLEGDLLQGITCSQSNEDDTPGLADDYLEPAQTMALWQRELGLHPFGYLGSNLDEHDPRWLSYLVASAHTADGQVHCHNLRPSFTERAAIRLIHLIRGRFIFHQRQSPARLRLQLLLNAFTGGSCRGNLRILRQSLHPHTRLFAKHLLVQSGGTLTHDRKVVYCRNCPDATIRNGRLVPACLSDRFTPPAIGPHKGKD